jgi:choice-of-anchor B domain-containing protein
MRALVCLLLVELAIVLSVSAEPYYQTREDYLNWTGSRPNPDNPPMRKSVNFDVNSKLSVGLEPEISAEWAGPTVWMSGVNWGGETFDGSIGKGKYFFGSNIDNSQYVPVRIIFQTGVPNQTLCQIFRRDLGYSSIGVGTFPGSAWDISDPGSPRRLNMCFVEDNTLGAANSTWDPSGTGVGKREYLYVMLSSYDGTGMTYAGKDGIDSAFNMDILYNWWPIVAAGHSFFENQPCTLTITPKYLKGLTGVPSPTEILLGWNYAGSATIDHFDIYWGTSSPANMLLDQVAGSVSRYTHGGLTTGQTYYYRVEAHDASRNLVEESREIAVAPQVVASNIEFLDFWNGRGLYGGCWGYTDSATGHEYALLACRNEGISIIDLSMDPIEEVGFMPMIVAGNDSKEVKVYRHYAIMTCEYEYTQIFDISNPAAPVKVSNVPNVPGSDGTNGSHNNMVDGRYLYIVGNHQGGFLEIFDIINPAVPVKLSEFGSFYYHDIDIVNDTLIGFGIYGEGMDLVDIGNKTSPDSIAHFNYAGSGAHNGEFLQGTSFIAIGDEIGSTGNHTRMFDLRDMDNIDYIFDIIVDPNAVAHNCYARNDTLFIAHYSEGVRMWDVSDPFNPVELGYYDTYLPQQYGYVGVWNVFPYFASGKIIASDMQSGLFVLQPQAPPSCCVGIRGDLNNDGTDVNVLDLTFCVDRIFRGGPPAVCPQEGDVNSDGTPTNVLDLTFIVDRIFRGGPLPGPC